MRLAHSSSPPSIAAASLFVTRYAALCMPTLAVACACALWLLAPRDKALALLAEGGVVEMLTETLYFAFALAIAVLRPAQGRHGLTRLALAVVLAACGAREADLHTAWTSKSILKLSYYLGDAPSGQKLLALFAVAGALAAASYLAWRWAKRLWTALKRGDAVAVTVTVFIVSLCVSKLLDRSVDVLTHDFGVTLLQSTRALLTALEELLELTLPLLVGLGIVQCRRAPFDASREPATDGRQTLPARP